jgi:hypothetical protein
MHDTNVSFVTKKHGPISLCLPGSCCQFERGGNWTPHYPKITTLLGIVCPWKALAEDAIIKKVTRFRERNGDFVNKLLGAGTVRENVKTWLSKGE